MHIPNHGPFTQNYVRDWLIYHGFFVVIGIITTGLALPIGDSIGRGFGFMLGIGIIASGILSAGIVNYLTDQSFE